ncbi:MAG: GspH/FimT family protein [Gammaproteobacteria bacterium]|nr:GspH/FimT family protein [Gammaproteobacteria bacterium]
MASLLQSTRMTSEINELMTQLNLARSEAIKRGTTVTLCKSANGKVCTDKAEWHDGLIIFVDENANHQIDGSENLIYVKPGRQGNVSFRYGGEKELYSYTTYHPEGYARPNATFTFCNDRSSTQAKAVIINTVGRPRSSIKDPDNKPLNCSWVTP